MTIGKVVSLANSLLPRVGVSLANNLNLKFIIIFRVLNPNVPKTEA